MNDRIHIIKNDRLLNIAERQQVRGLWREKLNLDAEMIKVSLEMVDLRELEDELRTAAVNAPSSRHRRDLYRIRVELDRLSAIKNELRERSESLSGHNLAKRFGCSKTNIYYMVHARQS